MGDILPAYFRCRTADKRLALNRLKHEVRNVFADLQPTSIFIHRVPSREQCRTSQQTEIVLHLPNRQSTRIALPKPVDAIGRQDLHQVLRRMRSR